jgi:hypothetical protein
MAERRWNPGLVIAAVLLLLPVLYVGSYLALVVPESTGLKVTLPGGVRALRQSSYRAWPDYAEPFFWPLEEIDRWARPVAWERGESDRAI